jgi:hypothetical protein
MSYGILVLGLISLTAPWLARWAGYETTRKPFDVVGVSGIFFLLTAAFGLGVTVVPAWHYVAQAAMRTAFVVGWMLLAIGGIWGVA